MYLEVPTSRISNNLEQLVTASLRTVLPGYSVQCIASVPGGTMVLFPRRHRQENEKNLHAYYDAVFSTTLPASIRLRAEYFPS